MNSVFTATLLLVFLWGVSPFTVRSTSAARKKDLSLGVSLFHGEMSDNDDRRRMEFMDLEPLPETEKRRERLERDLENRASFESFGDALWELRSKMDRMSSKLFQAMDEGHEDLEEYTREKLRDIEQRDPELVYMLEVADMEDATREGRAEDAEAHRVKALAARSCLPHFNLDGLWVGKYGNHGYELINITYVGDTLIASKVTGDKNVPRGEITFQVDLHPLRQNNPALPSNEPPLNPIMLTEKAAKKWGTKKLPRYAGLGQVAEEGFQNNQWMNAQLIVIGDEYFSFAWIPIEQQIFFGRPSPELALKMLRENGVDPLRISSEDFDGSPPSMNDEVELQKSYAMRCLEATHDFEDLFESDPVESCIWHGADSEYTFLE